MRCLGSPTALAAVFPAFFPQDTVTGNDRIFSGYRIGVECAVLNSVGGTMDDIAKVTVFVTDVADIAAIHAVRSEFFSKPYPASTLVQVAQLIDPDWLIEIDAVAVIPIDRIQDLANK